jgi:hypothetical protein
VRFVEAATRLGRQPRARLALAIAAFAVVTAFTYLIADRRMFTGFAPYDDEGYMLVALKSFLNHGSLYDDVFTQYGPFYYEAFGAVFSVFGVPATHDGGRTVALVVWVLSGLLVGLSGWRMTGSILLGLATQMLAFGAIVTVVNEPMHPGGIICLLLASIVAISCLVRPQVSVGAIALLGGAVMALILVKINVGAFALAALALTCVVSYPALARPRWLRPLVEIGFVALPLLLVTSKVGDAWARHYAVHVAVAALAVVIALRARPSARRPSEELWWLGGGLLVVGLTVCAAILGAGTSPGGLVEGILEQPLRQSNAFSIPLSLSSRTYLFDLLAITGALTYWYVARYRDLRPSPTWSSIVSVLSILIGAEMALAVIGRTVFFDATTFAGFQLALLSFAWVGLIPAPGDAPVGTAFARLLLPPLAVLQALHAFPVAGSQVQWSAFLLIPVGAICIANGVRGLAPRLTAMPERRGMFALAAVATAIAMVVLANVQLRQSIQAARASYDVSVPLDLPGAADVRLGQPEADLYRDVTAAIDANCRSFVMLPGMNSFYLWTEQEPPTLYNATGWPTLFDNAHQQRVIDETNSIAGLCLLRNIPQANAWGEGRIPPGPLVRYLERGFEPVVNIGDFELLKRRGAAGASS